MNASKPYQITAEDYYRKDGKMPVLLGFTGREIYQNLRKVTGTGYPSGFAVAKVATEGGYILLQWSVIGNRWSWVYRTECGIPVAPDATEEQLTALHAAIDD